eukprot:9491901-Pyramimonas_sp.AAC.2
MQFPNLAASTHKRLNVRVAVHVELLARCFQVPGCVHVQAQVGICCVVRPHNSLDLVHAKAAAHSTTTGFPQSDPAMRLCMSTLDDALDDRYQSELRNFLH